MIKSVNGAGIILTGAPKYPIEFLNLHSGPNRISYRRILKPRVIVVPRNRFAPQIFAGNFVTIFQPNPRSIGQAGETSTPLLLGAFCFHPTIVPGVET